MPLIITTLLIIISFIVFQYIKNNKDKMKSFLRERIEHRIAYYKVKALFNDELQSCDFVQFLEQQKNNFIHRQLGFVNNIIFSILRFFSQLTNNEYKTFIYTIFDEKIIDIIENDLTFKEFIRLTKAHQWDLSDWDPLLESTDILFQAKQYELIDDSQINAMIQKVNDSKTNYDDEWINENLIKTQQHVIQLLNNLKNTTAE